MTAPSCFLSSFGVVIGFSDLFTFHFPSKSISKYHFASRGMLMIDKPGFLTLEPFTLDPLLSASKSRSAESFLLIIRFCQVEV